MLDQLLADYSASSGSFDELLDGSSQPRAHWRTILESLAAETPEMMRQRIEAVQRQVRENGVTYNVYSDDKGMQRPWDLNVLPMILPHSEWTGIEAAVIQRAALLNQILVDVYGEQKMLEEMLNRKKGTPEFSMALLEVVFRFKGVKLIVTAIGTPPPEVVQRAHAMGIKFGAMVGALEHAIRQRDAGVDLIIAQGHEAGGHTGEITTMVLIPQVVDAVAPLPVLAAGGIGRGRQIAAALALGAEGVWCGSVWLTTQESDALPALRKRLLAARSSDTVRTRAFTGKHGRFLKSAWSDTWGSPGAPEPLGRPLQYFLRTPAFARIDRAGNEALVSSPIGQIVGEMNSELTVRQVFMEMLTEYADSLERMNRISE